MKPGRQGCQPPHSGQSAERTLTFWPSSLTPSGDTRSWGDGRDHPPKLHTLYFTSAPCIFPNNSKLFCLILYFSLGLGRSWVLILLFNPTLPWGLFLRSSAITTSTSQSQSSLSVPSKKWLGNFFDGISSSGRHAKAHLLSTHLYIYLWIICMCSCCLKTVTFRVNVKGNWFLHVFQGANLMTS